MKTLLTILLTVFYLVSFSQIKITTFSNLIDDVNNSTIDVNGTPSDFDLAYYVKVINTSTNALQIKVRTTEIDVLSGTENATCWILCPAFVMAGDQVVKLSAQTATIQPTDTNNTFVAHYRPGGLDGCSLFKYEWIDANDNSIVYGTLYFRFSHNVSTSCNASIIDKSDIQLNIYPNPTRGEINFNISEINGNVTFEIINLLGESIRSGQIHVSSNSNIKMNVEDLVDGIYFVTITKENGFSTSSKIIVKH